MKQIIRILATLGIALSVLAGAIRDADARGGGRGGGHSYSRGSHSRCVGLCYGVTSTRTGLPRNTYVRGYVKKDGTVVQPYTRSR
jgi:hypothetical protein